MNNALTAYNVPPQSFILKPIITFEIEENGSNNYKCRALFLPDAFKVIFSSFKVVVRKSIDLILQNVFITK